MDDPTTDARFFEQVAGDYPHTTHQFHGIAWTLKPIRTWQTRLKVWRLWVRQGRPRHRGVVVQVGTAEFVGPDWALTDWGFDAIYCQGVPALHYEVVDGVNVLRAMCGWHLPDLEAASRLTLSQLRFGDIW